MYIHILIIIMREVNSIAHVRVSIFQAENTDL